MESQNNIQIDENLYSRQLYVIGVDAMKKLAQASVLVSGLGGLGVEIAKNIILAGIKNVTIQDTVITSFSDLSSQFYLTEENIGQNRALACIDKLASLNEYVSVNVTTEPLTDELITQFNCLVITEPHPQAELFHIADFCHQNKIKFIMTQISGLFGYVFTDFGSEFISSDALGIEPSRFRLGMVTRAERGFVTIAEGEKMNIQDGDIVRFEEVEGMTELNNGEYTVLSKKDSRSFYIGDTRKFGEYQQTHRSGYGIQVIKPTKFTFKSLSDALKDPEKIQIFDFSENKLGLDQQVILAFLSATSFINNNNDNNNNNNNNNNNSESKPTLITEELLNKAKEFNDNYKLVDTINEKVFNEFVRTYNTSISPMAAIFGGIAGQEVLKALGNKFTPINQFLASSFLETLPMFSTKDPETQPPVFTLKNDRYDSYRKIFGDELFEKMSKMRYFLVGSGALGCEMLKNWAMMGIGINNGLVLVTDHDTIEKSNLNRQFLFRKGDIGHSKSQSAANAVKKMNPQFNVQGHQNFVGDDTRNIYNDEFYHSLNGICNALDNVIAREYMDSMSALYKLPLLESGTLGTKASFQIIIPGLTEQYSDKKDPKDLPGGDAGSCFITNSPSTIQHCCQWAKSQFEKYFVKIPESVNKFFASNSDHSKISDEELKFIEKVLLNPCNTWDDCLKYGKALLENLFIRKLEKLLINFPPDAVDEDGTLHWSHKRRLPHPLQFDPTNPRMINFILATATIRARIFGITPGKIDPQKIAELKVEKKKIKHDTRFLNDHDREQFMEKLYNEHPEWHDGKKVLYSEPFEKDSDDNMHMDFMEALVNLRAENYTIQPATKLEIKKIVGNIIPAIATTTAMVTGFICIEMYKVHSIKNRPIEDFKSGLVNLGGMTLSFWPPSSAKKIICSNGMEIDKTTVWFVEGNLTVKELIEECKKKYNIDVTGIVIGKGMVYMNFPPYDTSYNEKIVDYCVKRRLIEPPKENEDSVFLTLSTDDEELEIPFFKLKFR